MFYSSKYNVFDDQKSIYNKYEQPPILKYL